MKWSRRGVMAGMAATAGCTAVGPEFTSPEADLEARFLSGGAIDIGDVTADPWWTDLRDARLNGYVAEGLAANLNVKTALARIEQAEARVRQTGGPSQVSGGASASATRSGGDGIPTATNETYVLTGAYVFDLFGGVRRGREQSLAELAAQDP